LAGAYSGLIRVLGLAAFEDGVAKDPYQVTCYAKMGWLLRRLGREAEAERLLDFDRLASRREIAEVAGYQSVESFNTDLAAYILARPDLVGDLPETATQPAEQTATLFSDASASGRHAPIPVLFLARDGVVRKRTGTHLRRLRRDPEIIPSLDDNHPCHGAKRPAG
jgi:hypothetical protein